jgi:D-glycero-D-manno-heptose 1,7-bisphosphate phosphatase
VKPAAVFLDRDGTLNVEKDYVFRYEDWDWVPGALEGLRKFLDLGFRLVVVSNQSGVARGYYKATDVQILHNRVSKELEKEGIQVSKFYFCPHGPPDRCDCRKPKPGLILQAEKELGIDLSRSFMVGDKLIDVQAGQAAGVRPILVGTGYGAVEKKSLPEDIPFAVDLLAVSKWVEGEMR